MPHAFDPDRLRGALRSLAACEALPDDAEAYQRFYDLARIGSEAGVRCRLGGFQVHGYDIVAQLWLPERPRGTLFLMHGFYDHMGLYRHVIEWAVARELAVISCDLPGHGLSSGARASIGDFAEYQAVLDGLFAEARELRLPEPWHLCGQSTGGAIVIDHLLHKGNDSPAQGQAILLAPLVRPRAWVRSKLSYYMLRPFVDGIARQFSENSNAPAFLPFLLADPLQPRRLPTAWVGALVKWVARIEMAPPSLRRPLVIQGNADMTVDWSHNLSVLSNKFDQPEVLMIDRARHHLANELPELRQRYFSFLDERMN